MGRWSKGAAGVLAACLFALGSGAYSNQEKDAAAEKLAKRVAKIDKTFYKGLADLAIEYDKAEDPEAASFFAECAVGFGSKDEKIKEIKTQWEVKAYLGKIQDQAGKPLDKTFPIRSKLDGSTEEYKKIVQEMERKWFNWKKKIADVEMTDAERKIAFDVAVKYELARRAHCYVRCVKRINALRRGMHLRPVLWDFEKSRRIIVPCAALSDGSATLERMKKSIYYVEEEYKFVGENVASMGGGEIETWGEELRSDAFARETIMNPNARRIYLGHWHGVPGPVVASEDAVWGMLGYRIPNNPYREDIESPSRHYAGQTLAKGWIDTEEIFTTDSGRKLVLAYYPFADEKDVPYAFGGGTRGYPDEGGWTEEEWKSFMRGTNTGIAGEPVMLRLFGEGLCTRIEAKLVAEKSGKELKIRTYTNGDPRVPGLPKKDWPTVIIVPEGFLERGVTYTVSIKCKVDTSDFAKTWSFTTRAPKD